MGMWAYAPWDNDAAADWYGDFMDQTETRKSWLEGISQDPTEAPEVVRAAGALFVMLGRVYVWPIKAFDEDLERAILALARVAECDEYRQAPELVESLAREIEELKSRRKAGRVDDNVAGLSRSRPWWRFWQ